MSDICAIPDMYNCFLSDEEHSELIEQLDLPIEPYIFDFDECSRIWNSNKIKSNITGYYTYKDGATEIKQKDENPNIESITTSNTTSNIKYITVNKKHTIINNTLLWSQCGYEYLGCKCIKQIQFTPDYIFDYPNYDYEIYTNVKFCNEHSRFEHDEMIKRLTLINYDRTLVILKKYKNYSKKRKHIELQFEYDNNINVKGVKRKR